MLGDAKNLALTFDGVVRPLQVEPGASADLNVARMRFDARTGRFDATLEIPGSAAALRLPLHFTGSLTETFEAVVPTRALAQGEVLKPSDLAIERRPKAGLAPTSVTALAQASGLAAKPGDASPGRGAAPIRSRKASNSSAASEIVTITYEVPGILLTIRGQALEAGAEGDVINVLNTQSKRTIQAVVSGPGRVSVSTHSPRVVSDHPQPSDSRIVRVSVSTGVHSMSKLSSRHPLGEVSEAAKGGGQRLAAWPSTQCQLAVGVLAALPLLAGCSSIDRMRRLDRRAARR